jgi:hypothetical protein
MDDPATEAATPVRIVRLVIDEPIRGRLHRHTVHMGCLRWLEQREKLGALVFAC